MTEKEYCSTVCKAKCCKAPWLLQVPCPKLGADNLCSIYEERDGFLWMGKRRVGLPGKRKLIACRCAPIKEVLPKMPEDVKKQCCYHDPSLLTPNQIS